MIINIQITMNDNDPQSTRLLKALAGLPTAGQEENIKHLHGRIDKLYRMFDEILQEGEEPADEESVMSEPVYPVADAPPPPPPAWGDAAANAEVISEAPPRRHKPHSVFRSF